MTAANVDVAVGRDRESAVHGGDILQKAQRLNITVQWVEREQMALRSARGAVDDAVRGHSQRRNRRLAGRNYIDGWIAEVARIDAHLRHHGPVVFQSALCEQ